MYGNNRIDQYLERLADEHLGANEVDVEYCEECQLEECMCAEINYWDGRE